MADKTFLLPFIGIAVVFVALGFIQIVFQQNLEETIKASNRNFRAIIESEQEINGTLVSVNHTVVAVNETVTDLIGNATVDRQRDANLTREETEQLVTDLRTIPGIAISVNKTLERIEAEQPQSNFTAQAEAVANIEHLINLTESINRTLSEAK